MENFSTLVLAAGLGKRMKSRHPKVVHKICGKAMIEWIIMNVKASGSDDIVVVVGHGAEEVKEILKDSVKYALQEKQLGTGHAAMLALSLLPDKGDIMILTGDTPLITADNLKEFMKFHSKKNNAVTILSAIINDPEGYGRIIRDKDGNVIKIVEHKDATEEQRNIHEINSGIYIIKAEYLKKSLGLIKNDNIQGEYYLTDAVEIIKEMGGRIGAFNVKPEEVMGVNSRIQLSQAEKIMQMRINYKLMDKGVTLINPENTIIGPDVEVGIDTIIFPGTLIEGKTVIGEDCEIGPNCHIVSSRIGNGCKIEYSEILESQLGENIKVGPYARIRPDSIIHDNVKMGNFVEIKKSVIGKGTKVPHLTYIGDAEVGKNVNMGCGSIVVNYDGKKKHKSFIGDNVFVGCNVNLVSPVKIGSNTFIAAGSTITDDVPDGAMAIARSRQIIKEGWIEKYNKKGEL
ncbi:bifunctional UDP-N-acetylglucosamine diphosphorylase/glucosamine-1-phosphate N-acetyltransferase GlmU [Aceticella autotrophica]|uniref:Bifunctional protein GlmU n=1 Tax=Aceticella autotrophica TaxID=2755338 RepID=A0A975AVZ0_9THEO|nr:bifunctional UDP-N-acetylglucosamine diphosphorylase/glucosamine-1-phosphate N-acetyltransferase GlmU [Aceticella autotrophica]QSZ27467.1 bifunctional UDP-N-acetylglucosamine diphosphorylase/glucosamine-1-phosphate N-acetyltransferase GlmU [Aceticella autotrophica]